MYCVVYKYIIYRVKHVKPLVGHLGCCGTSAVVVVVVIADVFEASVGLLDQLLVRVELDLGALQALLHLLVEHVLDVALVSVALSLGRHESRALAIQLLAQRLYLALHLDKLLRLRIQVHHRLVLYVSRLFLFVVYCFYFVNKYVLGQ